MEEDEDTPTGVATWSVPEPLPLPFLLGDEPLPVDGGVGVPSVVEAAPFPLERVGVDAFELRRKLNVRPPFSRIASRGRLCEWSLPVNAAL